MEGPYKVEIIEQACEHCKKGALWGVVDDGGECLGILYEFQDDAEDIANIMNDCYVKGYNNQAGQVKPLIKAVTYLLKTLDTYRKNNVCLGRLSEGCYLREAEDVVRQEIERLEGE